MLDFTIEIRWLYMSLERPVRVFCIFESVILY